MTGEPISKTTFDTYREGISEELQDIKKCQAEQSTAIFNISLALQKLTDIAERHETEIKEVNKKHDEDIREVKKRNRLDKVYGIIIMCGLAIMLVVLLTFLIGYERTLELIKTLKPT